MPNAASSRHRPPRVVRGGGAEREAQRRAGAHGDACSRGFWPGGGLSSLVTSPNDPPARGSRPDTRAGRATPCVRGARPAGTTLEFIPAFEFSEERSALAAMRHAATVRSTGTAVSRRTGAVQTASATLRRERGGRCSRSPPDSFGSGGTAQRFVLIRRRGPAHGLPDARRWPCCATRRVGPRWNAWPRPPGGPLGPRNWAATPHLDLHGEYRPTKGA